MTRIDWFSLVTGDRPQTQFRNYQLFSQLKLYLVVHAAFLGHWHQFLLFATCACLTVSMLRLSLFILASLALSICAASRLYFQPFPKPYN